MNVQHLNSAARFVAFRLVPGDDLLEGLGQCVRDHRIQAGWIAGVVGSLSQASLRFAAQSDATRIEGAFEIVSLCGTLDAEGAHLHLSVSDEQGLMRGGHVMPGCIVRTTCELVVGDLASIAFHRAPCALSGYPELIVSPRQP